jgi:deoxycytidine triphosphate deaminase
MSDAIHLTPGVLAKDQVKKLILDGYITPNQFAIADNDIGPSAVDLPLGTKAWRLKNGQRPTTRELGKIQSQLEEIDPVDGYFEFKRKNIYLVPLDQYLKLPANISGRATGKSTIGRLDVITRLITEKTREYDLVSAGYEGSLHLLLMPQTFTIRVPPGASLNQLRLFSGSHSAAVITRAELRHYGTPFWRILKDGHENEYESDARFDPVEPTDDPLLLDLTVDLGDPQSQHIYKARPMSTNRSTSSWMETCDQSSSSTEFRLYARDQIDQLCSSKVASTS